MDELLQERIEVDEVFEPPQLAPTLPSHKVSARMAPPALEDSNMTATGEPSYVAPKHAKQVGAGNEIIITIPAAKRDFPIPAATRDFPKSSTVPNHNVFLTLPPAKRDFLKTLPGAKRDFPIRKDPSSPPQIATKHFSFTSVRRTSCTRETSATPSVEAPGDGSNGVEAKGMALEAGKMSETSEKPPLPVGTELLDNKRKKRPCTRAERANVDKRKPAKGPSRKGSAKGKRAKQSTQAANAMKAADGTPSTGGEGAEISEKYLPKEESSAEWNNSCLQVKQTLREYNALRRHFLQENENSLNKEDNILRPDLKAGSIMRDKGKLLNVFNEKGKKLYNVGTVPGVPVGMQFYFRQEMCMIGLHMQIQGGIDWVPSSKSPTKIEMATSVIASGGYEDDVDNGDHFDYTGQGGNNFKGDRKQSCDQVLVRGNLGLKNSSELGIPVRVIRGSPERNSESGMVYTYDGLYRIASWREEKGESGHKVFKFRLERLPGQAPLSSSQVEFVRTSLKSDAKIKDRKGLVVADISGGKEKIPVCCVNTIDKPPVAPPPFRYSSTVEVSEAIQVSDRRPQVGCGCKNGCSDHTKCGCMALNGRKCPYTKTGLLVELQTAVYECGPNCSCAKQPQLCSNRVSQNGLRYRFEVFKTASKGWGVRSWDAIPAGAFICEYTGILYTNEEADKLNDEYLYNLDLVKGNKDRWGNVSDLLGDGRDPTDIAELEDFKYCVDGREVGNFSRFINHSCEPNLVMQCLFYDHHDLMLPHLMLFAVDAIPPLKELHYDYNYTIGGVHDADGNVKSLACRCGAPSCRGQLY